MRSKKLLIGGVVGVIIFILAFAVVKCLSQKSISFSISDPSKANLINQLVIKEKSKTIIPRKLNEKTTLTNITAEPDAIRYHYILTDADTINFSNSFLKNSLLKKVCSNDSTKYVLNQDINLEYSYLISETGQKYFVRFNKANCQ